jgi:hypothetical protein
MRATLVNRLLGTIPILPAAMFLLVDAKPAHAMPCFTNLGNCYFRAAKVDSFWYRWAAGLDCETTFIRCLREDIGW